MRIAKPKMGEKKKSVEDYWQELFIQNVNQAMRNYIKNSPADPYRKREFLDAQFIIHKSCVAGALVEHDRYQKNLWEVGVRRL